MKMVIWLLQYQLLGKCRRYLANSIPDKSIPVKVIINEWQFLLQLYTPFSFFHIYRFPRKIEHWEWNKNVG